MASAQALAKISRGHARDREDVEAMLREGRVDRARLLELFRAIEPRLIRFPALDAAELRRRVEAVARGS